MTDFPEKVHELMRSSHRKIMQILVLPLKKSGITPPQMIALKAVLNSDGKVNVSDVCRALKTPLSNATNICARLESTGMLRRERDEGDRRRVVLTVTDKGKDAIAKAGVAYDKLNKAMDAAMDESKKNAIIDGFRMFDDWLEKYMDSEKSTDEREKS